MVKIRCHAKKDCKRTKHDKYLKVVEIVTTTSHLCCEPGSWQNIEF